MKGGAKERGRPGRLFPDAELEDLRPGRLLSVTHDTSGREAQWRERFVMGKDHRWGRDGRRFTELSESGFGSGNGVVGGRCAGGQADPVFGLKPARLDFIRGFDRVNAGAKTPA
jgi:hypothetical protein